MARSKEMKQELRRNAEQVAAKQAQKKQKRAAVRERAAEKQGVNGAAEQQRLTGTAAAHNAHSSTGVSPPAVTSSVPIARVHVLSDIIRDVEAYLLNRAATLNNALFTVRNLCETRDLFYKRDTIIHALKDLLSKGKIRVASNDGEELFCVVDKMLVQIQSSTHTTSVVTSAVQPQKNNATSIPPMPQSAAAAASHTNFMTATLPVKSMVRHPSGCDQCTQSHATHMVSMGPSCSSKKYGFFIPAGAGGGTNYDGTPAFKWHDEDAKQIA